MRCPRCNYQINQRVDYCPACGAVIEDAIWGAYDYEPETEVLLEDYRDFQDTIVDPVIGFDPDSFSFQRDEDTIDIASSLRAEPVQQAQRFREVSRVQVDHLPNPSRTPVQPGFPDSAAGRAASPTVLLPAPGSLGGTTSQNLGFKVAIISLSAVAVIAVAACVLVMFVFNGAGESRDTRSVADAAASLAVASAASDGSSDSSASKDTVERQVQDDGGDAFAELSNSDADNSYETHDAGGGLGNTRAPADALTEADVYDLLLEHYQKMSSYDKRIADCASDFNGNYAEKSKQVRSAKANVASTLASQIESDWDDLEDIVLPPLCRNASARESLSECYECLWHRIDTINGAWKVSLSYDDPAKHKDDILAPIKADQGSDGQNKYYTSFKKLYSSISLVKP